jgi:hypothetical protein
MYFNNYRSSGDSFVQLTRQVSFLLKNYRWVSNYELEGLLHLKPEPQIPTLVKSECAKSPSAKKQECSAVYQYGPV